MDTPELSASPPEPYAAEARTYTAQFRGRAVMFRFNAVSAARDAGSGQLLRFIFKADGFQLPLIMQLVKQWFSLEFNGMTGRKGHLWGERLNASR